MIQNELTNLNKIYKKYAPLWELDTTWDGFDWAALDDDNNNIISFFRKDKKGNAVATITVEISNHDQANQLMNKLQTIPAVIKVYRTKG